MSIARLWTVVALPSAWALAACGGGGGGDSGGGSGGGGNPPPASYTVGGTVSGLEAAGLVLQINGGNDLAVESSGTFTFSTPLASGTSYSVTVASQPSVGPAQSCTVANGSGRVDNAGVTSVTVTCTTLTARFFYVPNRDANSVGVYSIDKATGALTELPGSPYPADHSPALPAADRAGKFLYVSNRGSASAPPRISVYALDAATGAPTQAPGSPFELSHQSPLPDGAVFIARPMIHPSGAFGYVAVVTSGMLYGATVDSNSGDLTEITGMPVMVGVGIGVGTFNRAGTVLYLPHDNFNGLAAGGVSAYMVDQQFGILTPISSYATGDRAPTFAALNPAGTFLLIANASGSVAVFAVDSTTGTLTAVAGSPFPTGGTLTTSLTLHPTKNFVYATNSAGSNPGSVAAFTLDATTGVLTPIAGSPYPTNGSSALVGSIDPSGRFLYVSNRESHNIQGFAIDQESGALTSIPGSPFATGMFPPAVSIDPSGKYLYCAGSGSNTVSAYAIDASTGALSLINTVATGAAPSFGELVGLQ